MPSNICHQTYGKGIKRVSKQWEQMLSKIWELFPGFLKQGNVQFIPPPQKNFFFNLLELLHSFLLYDH